MRKRRNQKKNSTPKTEVGKTKLTIRRQQHKKFKHLDITPKEPSHKHRLGTISNTKLLAGLNRFYLAITSPSASTVALIYTHINKP